MASCSPTFKFQLDDFLFTFRTKVELINKIYIEYDIEVNGVYCATTRAKECLSSEQENNFRLKAAAKILKKISNPTVAKTGTNKKKVVFNKVKLIHEYNPLKQSFCSTYHQIY
jgi:hypothetical protein